jgi:hypothetical protein
MPDELLHEGALRFDAYHVDLRTGELRKHGRKIRLAGRPFQVLALLLEHPGELLTRQDLQERLWSADTFVDFEHGVNAAIQQQLLRLLFHTTKQPLRLPAPTGSDRLPPFMTKPGATTCSSPFPKKFLMKCALAKRPRTIWGFLFWSLLKNSSWSTAEQECKSSTQVTRPPGVRSESSGGNSSAKKPSRLAPVF